VKDEGNSRKQSNGKGSLGTLSSLHERLESIHKERAGKISVPKEVDQKVGVSQPRLRPALVISSGSTDIFGLPVSRAPKTNLSIDDSVNAGPFLESLSLPPRPANKKTLRRTVSRFPQVKRIVYLMTAVIFVALFAACWWTGAKTGKRPKSAGYPLIFPMAAHDEYFLKLTGVNSSELRLALSRMDSIEDGASLEESASHKQPLQVHKMFFVSHLKKRKIQAPTSI
jgi:hypothetical protein